MKNNYIIISSVDWKTTWQTQHRLADSLCKAGNRVLFIENTGIRNLQIKDRSRIISRVKKWYKTTGGFDEISKNFFTYTPLIFPLPYNKFISFYNSKKIFKHVKAWMNTVNYHNPIIISFLPTYLNNYLVKMINPHIYIYYAANNFGSQKGTENLILSERESIKRANINFVTSHLILKKLRKFSKKVFYYPASIEEKKFLNVSSLKPNILKKLKNPIIGYLGNFTDVFDIDLMIDVIKNSPEYVFLFLGDLKFYTSKSLELKKYENCYFAGEIANELVPNYLKFIKIGIIPYVVNDFTNGVYSSKLNEYLAMGLPVISTKIKEMELVLKKNKNLIYLSDNNSLDFKNKIQLALKEASKYKTSRINFAFKNSWDKKFLEITNIINKLIIETSPNRLKWKYIYLQNIKNYVFKFTFIGLFFYILIFTTPLIDFLGSKLNVQKEINFKEDNTIFVMSGYGHDKYFNNDYLIMAKELLELINNNSEYKKNFNIVISGKFQIFPESKIIKQILVDNKYDEKKLFEVSSEYINTFENIQLLIEVANKNNLIDQNKVLILTNPLHTKRTSLIIKKNYPNLIVHFIKLDVYNNDLTKLSKLKIISFEVAAIIYNFFKGNI
jgi:glycosyltransferase involved in cell wall biosynthesis